MKNNTNKYFVIKKACKYLDDKEKFKLIGLGKYFMKIKSHIYKKFLQGDISMEKG